MATTIQKILLYLSKLNSFLMAGLTPMQKELLKMFSFDHSDEYVMEIKKALCDYYQKKIDKEFDRLFEEGKLTMEMIESWTNEDMHKEMRERRDGKTGA